MNFSKSGHIARNWAIRQKYRLLKTFFSAFQKLDEIQVKVVVADIDDNGPTFLSHNMTLGKDNCNVDKSEMEYT